jgi:hypothetical protein
MRITAGSALALLIAGAVAAPAPAATLDAPGSAGARESVAVTADGLEPGTRYALLLAHDDASGDSCTARIAGRAARRGRPTVFSGTVPSVLRCPFGIPAQVPPPPPTPPSPPTYPVEPGRGYRFVICASGPADCPRVARASVQIVPSGMPCPTVGFAPDSDHGAFNLRARNVTCASATRVARGAIDGDRRYTRAGLRCRGTFDDHALPQTVYRCVRRGARVTFTAS